MTLQRVLLCGVMLMMFMLPYMTARLIEQVTTIPLNDSNDSKPVVMIGFLGSFSYHGGTAKLVVGAIPVALENINSNKDILPNHTLNCTYGDVGTPFSPKSIQEMMKMRDEGVVGFIGPDHSCATEATVASAWNIPMITYMCKDERISNKDLYPMIARTQPPSSAVAKYLISFLLKFNWNKITLIVSDAYLSLQVEESFTNLAKKQKITILERYKLPSDYLSFQLGDVKAIIKSALRKARIYVIISDKYSLVDFAREMYDSGFSSTGENAIVSVVDEPYDQNISFQYMRKEIEGLTLEKAEVSAFRCVFILAPKLPPNYEEFEKKAISESLKAINFHPIEGIQIRLPQEAGHAYDAVHVLAKAFTAVLEEGGKLNNGTHVMEKIRNQTFDSLFQYQFRIDGDGNVEGNYVVLGGVTDNKGITRLRPVGKFGNSSAPGELPEYIEVEEIEWINGVPPSEPECGFNDEKCEPDWGIILGCSVSAVLLTTAAFLILRKYQYEHKLACLLWKIDMKDVTMLRTNSDYTLQNFRNTINPQCLEEKEFNGFFERSKSMDSTQTNPFKIGFYRGNIVYIRPVYKRNIDITRAIRKEMVQMREMRHENINPFIGACVDYPNVSIMTLYCNRGSLDEVLQNEDLDLDNMFIASLVADLIKGMIYLHDSEVVSHGNLKSSKCLVDNRWVLQITDFGLHEFKSVQEQQYIDEKKKMHGQLWRAPELLRLINRPSRGTQKGDVYSFGIILYEVIGRMGPWGFLPLSAKCIVDRVMNPHLYGGQIYRPPLDKITCSDYIKRCMEDCWNETSELRPDFRLINVKLREMQSGLKPNIFDNMIAIMEKYAYNLEGLVQERTNQLVEEKKKTEKLLLRMLPKPVADQLKRGEPVEAESFDSVTIYFSDIVGFTALSAISTPLQVVDLLNDLYTCFDSIIENYDVYKVETIGDAYMVVSGLPIRNGHKHSTEIASMALHLLETIKTFEIRHQPRERLKLRIGIHSGSCVAGVVGLKMPRYCLFGDTVNTASRMESTGEALKIHVSEDFKIILDKQGGYVVKERGMTHIKGKGEMKTFWLIGKEPDSSLTDTKGRSYDQVEMQFQPLQDRTAAVINMADVDLRLLLGGDNDIQISGEKRKKTSDASNHPYNSCLSLFHECRNNALNEFRREGRGQYNGYRSAPIIEFRDISSRNYLL